MAEPRATSIASTLATAVLFFGISIFLYRLWLQVTPYTHLPTEPYAPVTAPVHPHGVRGRVQYGIRKAFIQVEDFWRYGN